MRSFTLLRPNGLGAAGTAAQAQGTSFIAGGTDLMQLMKIEAETPTHLVDLVAASGSGPGSDLAQIHQVRGGIRIGALATMAQVAAHPGIRHGWPMISEALLSAATPQIRNMGTAGGNLLQRTRCLYFRSSDSPCNKRIPGSGCPAIRGDNRELAILGTSAHCIATMPSDMPVALLALNADIEVHGVDGAKRNVPIATLYRQPGETPHLDTNLQPGEIITAIFVPASAAAMRSTYVKIRDRQSYQFAVVSVAVGLEMQAGKIGDVRIAFGGVGTTPWRVPTVEAALIGKEPGAGLFQEAAAQAAEGALPSSQNAFKATLMSRVLTRTLQTLTA